MSIIKLGEIEYILESTGDETITAHNYDDVIDMSKSESPDEWFGRVQAEWPNLPDEIKTKIVDSTGQYIGSLSNEVGSDGVQTDLPLDEARKDSAGNEVYDFAEGRQHAASLDNDALEYVRKDLINVIKIQEESSRGGHNTPKLGYYWDEYWTVIDEIARRMKAGQTFNLEPWSIGDRVIDDKVNELGE